MPKRNETVTRWLLANKRGHFSIDVEGSQFNEELEDAYVFVSEPPRSEAVHPVEVTVTIVRGAD